MAEKKKKNGVRNQPANRFHKFVRIAYLLALAILLAFPIIIFIRASGYDGEVIYLAHTLWILMSASLILLVSNFLYLFRSFLRGILLMIFTVIFLIFMVVITGESAAPSLAAIVTLRHTDHVYYIEPTSSSSWAVRLLECEPLGIVCDVLEVESLDYSKFDDQSGRGFDVSNDELRFDESQNAILWLQDGEVIFTHPLE